MAFFGLKLSLDLEMPAAHPHQKFPGVPLPGIFYFDQNILQIFFAEIDWVGTTV